jgi:hypothetical protein
MDVNADDLLLALGEKAAENFVLRRHLTRAEQEIGALYARIEEFNAAKREEPQPIHAQPDPQPQLWPDRER